LPKVNSRPKGENSPNLVTLVGEKDVRTFMIAKVRHTLNVAVSVLRFLLKSEVLNDKMKKIKLWLSPISQS
jgi:hypothetical protein